MLLIFAYFFLSVYLGFLPKPKLTDKYFYTKALHVTLVFTCWVFLTVFIMKEMSLIN